MEEVYWISGAEFHYPPEDMTPQLHSMKAQAILKALLAGSRTRPGSVNEIHWQYDTQMGGLSEHDLLQAGFPPAMPAFSWETRDVSDHFLLQSAARAILADDAHLMILGQQVGCATSALLLASPDAVGIYNLNPQARLAARFSFSASELSPRQAAGNLGIELKKRSFTPETMRWAALSGCCMEDFPLLGSLPAASILSVSAICPVGALYQANVLVRALQEDEQSAGLLLGRSSNGQILVTVFERV
jgi:hypothetical protein